MNTSKNMVVIESLKNLINTTVATVGTIVDLSNYVNVGKRNVKLTIGVVDCKSTASTTSDQTVSVTWYESDSTSSTDGTAISGAAISAATASAVTSYDVLVTKRYVFASALSGGTTPAWGVVANVIPLRRDF